MFETYMITGFLLTAFGWWGANTKPGIRVFASNASSILPVSCLIVGTGLFTRGLWLFVRR